MTQPTPAIGLVVHYASMGSPVDVETGEQKFASTCRAATITEVSPDDPDVVGLCVQNPTGFFFHPLSDGGSTRLDPCVSTEPGQRGGTWHWPAST